MADTGAVVPTVAADVSSDWTDLNNVLLRNAALATATVTSGDIGANTATFQVSGFDFSAVPWSATLDGIELTVRHSIGVGDDAVLSAINITHSISGTSGTTVGDNKGDAATTLPTSQTDDTYGGSSDIWGAPVQATIPAFRDSTQGFRLVYLYNGADSDISVDVVECTLTYTTTTGVTERATSAAGELSYDDDIPGLDDQSPFDIYEH